MTLAGQRGGRPPHVAVVTTLARLGGAERSLVELVRRTAGALSFTLVLPEAGPLAAAACEAGASVAIETWPPALAEAGERAGGPRVVPLARAATAVPGVVRGLRRTLARLAPDVVVTNGLKAHALAALAREPGGPPLVWYAREGLEDRPRSRAVLRLLGGRADGVVAISRYVASEFRPLVPLRAPVHVVRNVVDLERFRPGLAPAPDLAKAAGEVRFGVVGALTPLKGQDVFLDAAAVTAHACPQARFVVAGGVPYRTEARLGFDRALAARATALGIVDRVRFLGERDDVPAVLASLDVLVQPNRGPEGLGRAVLEGLACGLPVVAVDRWGPREIVRDGETGFLVPPLDVHALATRMLALATDPALRARLGRAARGWIVAHGDPQALTARFCDVVAELAGRPGSAPAPSVKESSPSRR